MLANVSSDPDALRSALALPLEFTLQLSAEADDDQEEDHQGLIAFVLLSVAFPPLYPDPTAPPRLQLVDVMVVKAQHEQAPTEARPSVAQLGALAQRIADDKAPFLDFALFGPFAKRSEKQRRSEGSCKQAQKRKEWRMHWCATRGRKD